MKIYHYPSPLAEKRIQSIIHRSIEFNPDDVLHVTRILDDIKTNGDASLIRYINQYDCPVLTPETLKVTDQEIIDAEWQVSSAFVQSLDRAASQIESFHRRQVKNSWICTERTGTLLGQLILPVDAAGVYVPGGKSGMTPLVSSVLMGVIPAKIAGVKHICMATPPTKDGTLNPHLLVAAKRVGVTAIYKAGSAWAIGALAYGTDTIPKVDVIVGPGNIYVTLAKKIVAGTVGIDLIAGPSEILVIADDSAVPKFIAADLLSQAEHDPMASAILVTPSQAIADSVTQELETQLARLSRKEIAQKSLDTYGAILVVPDIEIGFDIANRIAPEHLELQINNPFEFIGHIKHCGAVFLGNYTPEPVGDYIAGPNHVLPTAGTAKFSSALSVDHFMKKTSVIQYSKSAFFDEADDIIRIAEIEGLDAHANSIRIRK